MPYSTREASTNGANVAAASAAIGEESNDNENAGIKIKT
jgi:hypothetical protein